jgi:hypothetical protein
VTLEWRDFANSAQFRATQEAVLLAVVENDSQRLLCDLRHAKVVLVEDERWVVEDMVPRLARTGLRHTAVVMPQNQLANVIASDLTKATRPRDATSTSEQFGSVAEAKVWLSRTETLESRR